MNYYILKQHSINKVELDEVLPDSIDPDNWLKGKMIDSPLENLTLDLSLQSEDDYGSLIMSFLPIFHSSFIQALTDFGIDTIQYTPVNLREQNSDEMITSYSLANIIGLYDCLDKNKSKIDKGPKGGVYISKFVIDESKTNGAKIFRMYDDPRLIIITEDLKDYLESLTGDLALYQVDIEKTEKYYHWHEKPYWSSLTLTGFTKKLFHLLHKWTVVENDSYLERAKILLENGADPNFTENGISYALDYASGVKTKDGGIQLARLLIQFGVDIHRENVLFQPSYRGNSVFTEFLLEQGVTNDLESAITIAIEQNHPLVVKAILEKSQIDRYAIIENDLSYTPLHLAVAEGREEIIKIMLPYYDLEKCNEITPLDSLNKKKNIRELLGLNVSDSGEFGEIDIANLDESCIYCKTDYVFLTNLSKAQSLYDLMTKKQLLIDGYLMPWDALLADTIPILTDNLTESFETFRRNMKQSGFTHLPLQGISIEYAGAVTDPFDAVAMANGYSYCDDSLSVKKALFTDSGNFDFETIFEDIDELTENFPDVYSEIHEYLSLVAFLHLHIAFSHFVRSDVFKSLSITKPFYFFGNEHDYDHVLIYKLE
jgi:hypothetical protein